MAPPASAILLGIGTAIRERRQVSIHYRSWRDRTSTRAFDPYGLVFHSGRWYVTGYDHGSGEVRVFRLDRIASVAPGETGFRMPEGFDPVGHVARSLAAVPYRWEVEVLLETDLASAQARLPPTVAELAETAGGVRLRARAERLDGMASMLAGLGWPFTVVRPEELRQAVVARGSALIGYAERRIPDT